MEKATEAHRAALICALLGVVGTALGVIGFLSISGTALRLAQLIGILVNGAVLWILQARRRPFSPATSNALFLFVLVPTVVMVWMLDDARAAHSARWVPYEPNKLSALTLAMIAPPGWSTGIVGILMFVGTAVVHQVLLPEGVRARMAVGEPFGVIAYGVFALVVLAFKQRSLTLRDELERARADKLTVERVARVAMALRDLANTPVQTLELIRQVLLGDPRLDKQTERMGRALERLRQLNDLLLHYQNAVPWDGTGQAFESDLAAICRVSASARAGAGSESAARSRAPPAPRRPA
jgi:hypothetical protein